MCHFTHASITRHVSHESSSLIPKAKTLLQTAKAPSPPRKAFNFIPVFTHTQIYLSISQTIDSSFRSIINGVGMGRSWLRCRRRGNHGPSLDSPRPRWPPQRSNRRHSQPSQAIPLRRPLLPLLTHGHLLEIRDSPHLRIRLLYPF